MRWSRRGLLWVMAGVALDGCRRNDSVSSTPPAPLAPRFDGFPIDRLDGFLTPTADFFVRDHFGVPAAANQDPARWTLAIEGEVARPLHVTVAELAALPQIERPVTLECAGNAGPERARR